MSRRSRSRSPHGTKEPQPSSPTAAVRPAAGGAPSPRNRSRSRSRNEAERVTMTNTSSRNSDPSTSLGRFNLESDTTEDELRTIFEKFGRVVIVQLIRDRESGRPKGFAFVEMESTEISALAKEALNGSTVRNRQVRVDFSFNRGGKGKGKGKGKGDDDRPP